MTSLTLEIKRLPCTASKDVVNFVKSGNLKKKIENNPSIFLKFVQQAYQDHHFFYSEANLMIYSFSILTDLVLKGRVAMDAVAKAAGLIAKFHKRGILGCGDMFFIHGEEKVALTRLFLIPHFTALKERWLKKPDETLISIKDYLSKECTNEQASFIIKNCMQEVFLTIFEMPFEAFIKYEVKIIYHLIHLCRNLGYQAGYIGMQKVFCSKINDFKTALEEYINAKKNKFENVESFCRNYIKDVELYESHKDNRTSYVAVTFLINSNLINGILDLRSFTKGYLNYAYPILNNNVTVFLTHFYPVSMQAMMLNCEAVDITVFSKRAKINTANPLKLESLPLEHLVMNGQSLICTGVYAGLFLFFKKVATISFARMKGFHEGLIKEISAVRPDIDCLTVSSPETITAKDVEDLKDSFDRITKIGFCFAHVKKEFFKAIFKNPNICKLELAHSTFELPEDVSLLSRIVQLEVMYNDQVPFAIFNRLFQAAFNVRCLCIAGNKGYSLKHYPYPDNIFEISGFFDHIYEDRLVLGKFRNLKNLKILSHNPNIGFLIPFLPPNIHIDMMNVIPLK